VTPGPGSMPPVPHHGLLLALSLFALGACGSAIPPATRPIRTVGWSPDQARRSDRLLVLLPGRLSPPDEFRSEGLETELARTLGPVDQVAVDAHLGYYLGGGFVETLAEDVLAPARKAGFRDVWIVGVSLGGSGALATLKKRPELVDGLVLLAPYLGSEEVVDRVKRFGREILSAPPPSDPKERFFEEIWAWLLTPDKARAPIVVGYGRSDRFVASHRFLATLLRPDRVVEVDGGHDWSAWRRAMAELLRRGIGPPRR
jgi:pimeloyl-ACP methyl ester carboxylesterase